MREIRFVVHGTPVPQGSTRAFIPKGWKRAIITTDNTKLKPWRQQVSGTAASLDVEAFPAHVPVTVTLDFYFARPKTASVKKRPGMTTKPDVDKLIRACFDACKGILFHDDAQIVSVAARKFYCEPERVEIVISESSL